MPYSLLGAILWGLAALFFLYEFFLRAYTGIATFQIIQDLQINARSFTGISSAFYIIYGLMQVPVGMLIDRYGLKRMVVTSVCICAIGALLFSKSTTLELAIIARLLMGLGSSFAFISLIVIATTEFPQKYTGFISGASQFIGTLGPILSGGPLIAVMASTTDWRRVFGMLALLGFLLAGLIFCVAQKKSVRILVHSQHSFKSLLKNSEIWTIALYSATVYLPMTVWGEIWGAYYLQTQGLSLHKAAQSITVLWIGYAIGCPTVGLLWDYCKRRKGFLMLLSSMGLLINTALIFTSLTDFEIHVLFFGLGVAASGQNLGFALLSERVNPRAVASALGFNNGIISFFGICTPIVIGSFSGATIGFALLPLLNVFSLLICLLGIKGSYDPVKKEAIINP